MGQRKFVDIFSRGRSHITIPSVSAHPLKNKKVLVAGSVSLAVLLSLVLGSLVAHADLIRLYPANCLGDWENPNKATGEPQLEGTSPADAFTTDNSAFLLPYQEKSVYCGGFSGGDNQTKLVRVRLNLSWAFKQPPAPLVTEPVVPTPQSSGSRSGEALESATSTETSTPSEKKAEPVDQPTPTQPEPVLVPSSTTALPEPVVQPKVTPTPAVETPPQAFLQNFLGVAHAQEVPREESTPSNGPKVTASLVFNGITNFLDVQYTLDGSTWQSIDNANLELPFTTWDEVRNVQIRIVNLRSGGDLPSVYLDAMWLEARYVPDDTVETDEPGVVKQVADAVSEAVSDSSQSVISFVADQVAQVIPSVSQEAPKPEPRVIVRLDVSPEPLGDRGAFLASVRETIAPKSGISSSSYSVDPAGDRSSLTFDGACSARYFTVLFFRSIEDVVRDPARAIINRAFPCEGGRYHYELSVSGIPSTLDTGTYYAFIADQESSGPWKIITDPVPVRVTKTIE